MDRGSGAAHLALPQAVIPPAAIQRFTERQRGLIHDTYDRAWQQGVAGYEPDADPEHPTPAAQHYAEETTLTGAALLAARARRAYQAPTAPDPQMRQQALAGALASTEHMAGELATVAPTPEHFAEAQEEAGQGKIDASAVSTAALALAVASWAESNAYRLNLGDSVAWAGEQTGYAQAADTDGQLLQWQSEDDDRVCVDCEGLEAMGPMPLADFPTTPGDGATACSEGCRCSLEAADTMLEGDEPAPLSEEDNATLDKVATQAQERLDRLAPNFAVA